MNNYVFGQFTLDHLKNISEGVILFNDGFYWECHEELEDLWLEHTGDNAKFVFWSILQVAAGLYHLKDDNLLGAWGMVSKAQEKIKKCEALKVETDLLYRFLKWKEFKALVLELNKNSVADDYSKLANFKFSNPKKWDLE